MAKKRPQGESRKTPRVNVAIPEAWHAVARRIAAKQRQPVIYALIALIEAEAVRLGLPDLPAPPWADEEV